MPESDQDEAMRSMGVMGAVSNTFFQTSEPGQKYVQVKHMKVVAGLKEELTRLDAADAANERERRHLIRVKAENSAKGFTDSDPEIYLPTDRLNRLEESLRMSPHVRENIQNLIKHHQEIADRATDRLKHIVAVKSRSEKT